VKLVTRGKPKQDAGSDDRRAACRKRRRGPDAGKRKLPTMAKGIARGLMRLGKGPTFHGCFTGRMKDESVQPSGSVPAGVVLPLPLVPQTLATTTQRIEEAILDSHRVLGS